MNTVQLEYLRLSVTSRCSLNCFYCRPAGIAEGLGSSELSVGQMRRLVECAAAEGARKVRVTGGEPLERADLEEIVAAISSVPGIRETVMTTSGVALAGRAHALEQAGLQRVNVSLDTLRPERFARLTGRDAHAEVMAGIEEARRVFATVKVNTVLLRGRNDDEIEDMVEFGASAGIRIRFVERYPTGCSAIGADYVTVGEAKRRVAQAFGALVPLPADSLSVESAYRLPGAVGATVGFIASASGPPCETCRKLRVTAAGVLLPCLFAQEGRPLGQLLGAEDMEGVRTTMREMLAAKRPGGQRRRVATAIWQIGG
ncbi:MAG: GTP 3',8-cyclase MoaA [Planctomycetota bacterium]|jgi:cyclic pyranopterin phosphate synthase